MLQRMFLSRAVAACAAVPALPSLAQQRTASSAASSMYFACAVYVSEAREAAIVQRLEQLARSTRGAALANVFIDEPYNRTNFTLVGRSPPQLAAAVVALAQEALQLLDLRQHNATHPRLGIVDHISCHPLTDLPASEAAGGQEQQQRRHVSGEQQACGSTAAAAEPASSVTAAATAALAQSIAVQLGSGPQALPVFTYGWAHPQQQPLDEVRRQLGYFTGAAASSWQGALAAEPLPLAPCHGPAAAPPRSGVCCVGAVPWLVNYNVLLYTDDLAAARTIARAVSQRGGGLPGVQAMALRHTEGVEVACNLLDPAASPPEAVLAAVRRLAAQHGGLTVGPAYRTNKSPEQLVAAAAAQGV